MPGAAIGLQAKDPTIATALKAQGYATGQFGKNHLGDRDELLPTAHGFDEFFGNLYHLNAEEEPELRDYPTAGGLPELPGALRAPRRDPLVGQRRRHPAHRGHRPAHQEADGDLRRGVPRRGRSTSSAASTRPTPRSSCGSTPPTCTSAPTPSPRAGAGPVGGSPSTTTRCSTTTTWSATCSPCSTSSAWPRTRSSCTPPTTGPHMNTWPDGGMTPFRNEKNSNWEGAYRVPAMVRWPGKIEPGQVLNGIVSHNDWFPTLLAAAGVPDIAEQLKAGAELDGTTYKVHLDGHNQLPYLTGEVDESPRRHFFYVSDDGDLTALRFDDWKLVFLEQRAAGHARHLGGALHRAARPEDLQPAHRPLRAGRHHVEHLLRLAARPRLAARAGAGLRRRRCSRRWSSSRRRRSRPASASTRCWPSSRRACPSA